MRILITTFSSRPQANGVAEVVAAHADGLRARGHDVMIATSFDPARSPSEIPPVTQFAVSGSGNLREGFHGQVREYVEFVRAWRGDAIMCHGWQHWATDLAVRAFPGQPAKKILVSHGFSAHRWPPVARFPKGLPTWLSWQPYVWNALATMRRFDHLVFLADLPERPVYRDLALARRAGLKNISCIPSGVHLAEFDAPAPDFRKAFGITEKHCLLCVAAYAPTKNQLLPLQAFARTAAKDVCLVFIGAHANDYSAHLSRVVPSLRPPGRVLFLEKIERPMLVAAYRAASLFLYGSLWESGPLVLLEAMAARTPFVSTDVGFASTLPGGVVVTGAEDMADAVDRLLADEDERARLGRAGRDACERVFHWPAIIDRYDALLRRIVA